MLVQKFTSVVQLLVKEERPGVLPHKFLLEQPIIKDERSAVSAHKFTSCATYCKI